MNNINDIRIRPIAETGEAVCLTPQRGSRYDNQWTPEAVAALVDLAGAGKSTPDIIAAMALEFGPKMTREAVRGKGLRLGVIGRSLTRKKQAPKPVADTGDGWSLANMALLRDLVAKGQSAGEIAPQLVNERGGPMSRNAIIAKCHRLDLSLTRLHGWPFNRTATPRIAPVRLPAKAALVAKVVNPAKLAPAPAPGLTMADVLANAQGVAAEPRHDGVPVGIMELRVDGCKWVLGDPLVPGFGYCGNRQHAGPKKQSPYCGEHHARAYGGSGESEKSAHRVRA